MSLFKKPSFLLGMAIMFFAFAGCSAVLPGMVTVLIGSKGVTVVKAEPLPTITSTVTLPTTSVPTLTPTASLTATQTPTPTRTPVPLSTPVATTCFDFGGRTLKVDEVNPLGQKCLPGNRLLQPDGKLVVNGLPSPTPKK